MDTGQTQTAWLDQVRKIITTLREGHAIAEEIIGDLPSASKEGPHQEPSNQAERLTDELRTALIEAQHLSEQLRRITELF